jgi:glycosyltransferase involved in cell wall biosynthesis
MSKHIVYVTSFPLRQLPDGSATSDAASTRYRVIQPGSHLMRRGHRVAVVSPPQAGWDVKAFADVRPDALVFSKSFDASNLELAKFFQARGSKIIFDICDDRFGHGEYGGYFKDLAAIADQIVASTEQMADVIHKHTGRTSTIISDPLEGKRASPSCSPRFPRVKLLWFGHESNLPSLFAALPDLLTFARKNPCSLEVVTALSTEVIAAVASHNAKHAASLGIALTPWSPAALEPALAKCDIVIIPSANDPKNDVKSPNRLLESLWAGKYVVARPVPSYRAYGDYCWLGNRLSEGLDAALNNVEQLPAIIAKGQDAIAFRHSSWRIANEWETVLTGSVSAQTKLNLGCGDKILPDYLNVDVVANRAGHAPDLMCDLRHLACFPDGSADEILAVHVIEHFWRWEVRAVLKEWLRLLKPGAPLILECPNLESACQTFLSNPREAFQEDARGQQSMWVFYGDPAWQDPYMIHRWGYTVQSLIDLLGEVGFVDARQEPAQFKLREPRDMRVVARKP